MWKGKVVRRQRNKKGQDKGVRSFSDGAGKSKRPSKKVSQSQPNFRAVGQHYICFWCSVIQQMFSIFSSKTSHYWKNQHESWSLWSLTCELESGNSDLEASLEMGSSCVHDSTVHETLKKHGVCNRTPAKKPLLTKTTLLHAWLIKQKFKWTVWQMYAAPLRAVGYAWFHLRAEQRGVTTFVC